MEQRTLGLWQSKIIHPHPFDEFEQNLEIKNSRRLRGKARGGGKRRNAQKESRKEERQNRETIRKKLDFFKHFMYRAI